MYISTLVILFIIVIYIILVCNRTVGVSSASLRNSQFGESREDSLSYVIIIVIYFIIHIKSLRTAHQILMKFGQKLQNMVFGLLALAVEAYGITLVRPFVRPFVRHTISGDQRIRF